MRTPEHVDRTVGAGLALLMLLTTGLAVAEPPPEPESDGLLGAPPPPVLTPRTVLDSTDPAGTSARAEAAAAPQLPTSRVHLSLNAFGGFVLDLSGPPSGSPGAVESSIGGGGVIVGGDVFFRRLLDDDSPRLLQPFLQRASTFSVYAGGRGTRATYSVSGTQLGYEEVSQGAAGVGLSAYLTRSVRLSASLGFGVLQRSSSSAPRTASLPTLYSLPIDVGLGARLAGTLIEVVYGLHPQSDSRGRWGIPFWGGLGVSLRSVILRRHDLTLSVRGLREGAAMGARFASYPTQVLGFWIGLGGTYQSFANSVGGELGISYFRWRKLGAQLSFSPTWSTASSFSGEASAFEGVFSLTLFSRA